MDVFQCIWECFQELFLSGIFSLSSPSGTSTMHMLICLMAFHRSLRVFSFSSFFFIVVVVLQIV